jgi:hypothetical protein
VHFFGQNAFSVVLDTLTPSNKQNFATSHEAGMSIAGWLIRQLEEAAKGNHPAMFAHLERALGADATKHFHKQQNAGKFIHAEKGKYFHTKIWLTSPTLVIIAISPLKDHTKTMVVVWTVGHTMESAAANAIFAGQGGSTLASSADPADVNVLLSQFPGLRANPLASAARFRTSLPLDLELELQSL